MSVLRRAAVAAATLPLRWAQWVMFRVALAAVCREDRVVFIDIDNTLADTWPTLIPGMCFLSETGRLASLKPLHGTHEFVKREYGSAKAWVFLSYRPLRYFLITRRWLQSTGIWRPRSVLCLVDSVPSKLKFIEAGLRKTSKVSLVDDLSYHHEHGEVKFNDEIIRTVSALGVEYHGYAKIAEVNR